MNKYFMTLPLIFFGLLSFTTPVLAAAITSLSFPVHIINPQLPAREAKPPRADNIVSYYRQLNASIASRNPIADAKQAITKGYMGTLIAFKPIISLYQERILLEKKLGDPYQGLDADMKKKLRYQSKVIQGAGFRISSGTLKEYKGGLLNAEKVVDTYAQSAYRYAYYWNRTMAAHLKQQAASGQVVITDGRTVTGHSVRNPYTGVWVYNLFKDSANFHEKIQATWPNVYWNTVSSLHKEIIARNPVLDAKREIATGQVFFLTTKGISHFPGAAKLKQQMNMTALFQGVNNWQKIPKHVIQGASFAAPNRHLPDSSRNKLDLFAQSAYRYAYYWNRTMAAHLKQQQTSAQAGSTSGITDTTAPADNTHHTTNNTGGTVTPPKTNSFPWWRQQVQ